MTEPFPQPGFALGIANVPRETDLPALSLQDALNVDIDDAGNVLSRPGQTVRAGGVFHSLWSHPSIEYALCIKNGSLSRIDSDLTTTALSAVAGSPVCYCLHNDTVYWLSPVARGAVRAGQAITWGLPIPAAPTVSAQANGGLFEGEYLLSYVYQDATGQEGGASAPVAIGVADNGLISLIQVPTTEYAVRVYRSPVNGDVLYAAFDIPQGASANWVIGQSELGKPIATEYLGPPPAGGDAIASYRGRLYIAQGAMLYFSEPGNPNLFNRPFGYFQHPEPIVMLASVEDGLYIASRQRTWFRQGLDPVGGEAMMLRLASGLGAVPGNPILIPAAAFSDSSLGGGLAPAWVDSRGDFCVGRAGGAIQQPLAGRFRARAGYQRGAGAYWTNAQRIGQLISVFRY